MLRYPVRLELEQLLTTVRELGRKLIYDKSLLGLYYVFEDREDAGRKLAELLRREVEIPENSMVFAIPCGGVPVAYVVATELGTELDLVICRKILIPWNPEAGYGAVAPDGTYVLNETLVRYLGLSEEDVREGIERTLREIRRREQVFRSGRSYPDLRGRTVIVVDDGIASGYTMLVATRFLKKLGAEKIIVATPTASASSLKLLSGEVDLLCVVNVRSDVFGFAVADAYRNWYDLSDEEVLEYLSRYRRLKEKGC